MKKIFNKVISFVLCCTMIFGAVFTVGGVTKIQAQENETQQLKSIFSIDAGRKYFSEEQLKSIIDKAYKNGYTDVQILLGNDALRFFLADMTMEVNGITYSSDDVKAALTKGNKHYYDDPNGNALTEAEMDRILAYAKERGLSVVPVINSPGHMDSILVAMEELGLEDVRFTHDNKVSERTVNIENDVAVKFTHELVKKYATYFGNSGASEIFNFGADEYANDVFGNPGWSYLQDLGLYDEFIAYVNENAKIIKDAGMEPMCFNDGIYYNSKDNFGTFDKDIIISYWTAGWWGFYVAKPEYLAEKGHKILNTNDAWYWVLGNVTDGGYKYENTTVNIDQKEFTDVTGATSKINIIGSMQCVWCDDPSKEHDFDRIFALMDQFSTKHADYLIRPADYNRVDEVIASVPTNLEIYTQETVAKLNNAINAVIRNKRVTEQDIVDGYAIAIESAIKELVIKSADYTKVEEAISSIPNDLTIYTEETVKLLNDAKAAVVYGLDITKQNEVNAMAKSIQDAVAALVLKEDKKPEQNESKPNPNTGDTINLVPMMLLLIISGGLGVQVLRKKRG